MEGNGDGNEDDGRSARTLARSVQIPVNDLAFADLVSRELRGRVVPEEQAALDAAEPADLERWLAALERFRDDVTEQLRSRAGRMETLLTHGNRDLWERDQPRYDEWRNKASRFQNVLVHKINHVRRRLRLARPGQVTSVGLLRRAVELDPTDAAGFERWQQAARRWLRGADPDEPAVPVKLVPSS